MRLSEHVVRRIDVQGQSMAPALIEGQRVTAWRRWRRLRPGDVVVTHDPRDSTLVIIKRVVRIEPQGVFLEGDNRGASTDSRSFGAVDVRRIRWIVSRASMR